MRMLIVYICVFIVLSAYSSYASCFFFLRIDDKILICQFIWQKNYIVAASHSNELEVSFLISSGKIKTIQQCIKTNVKMHRVCHDKGCVKGSWRVTPNSDLHLLTLLNEHERECDGQQVAPTLLELVVSCLHDICVHPPPPSLV